jgi:F-type H+-transporting ATPase subunit epsilon
MASTFICDIVTPERLLYSEEVNFVAVPATEGDIGMHRKVAPVMSTLRLGEVHTRVEGSDAPHRFAVDGGYVEADGQKVVVLATRATRLDEVSLEQVREQRAEYERRVSTLAEDDPQTSFARGEIAWYELLERLVSSK